MCGEQYVFVTVHLKPLGLNLVARARDASYPVVSIQRHSVSGTLSRDKETSDATMTHAETQT